MLKVFISQPMNGKTDEEIQKERERVIQQYRNAYGKKVKILDSIFNEAPDNVNTPLWILSQSLELMAQADQVFFCKGWENARGCKIEYDCAVAYGIDVIEE